MGHEFVSLQSWAVSAEAVPLAQGQQRIGAGVDKARLRLADHSVHCGEEQEKQGELVGEAPGQRGPLPPVVVPQGGKKGGGLKQVIVGHSGGHLPVQGGGGGAGSGVDGVVKFHVPGGDPNSVVRLPDPQGTAAEEAVCLSAEGHAQGGVRDPPAKGAYGLLILPVGFGGGHTLPHRYVLPFPGRWMSGRAAGSDAPIIKETAATVKAAFPSAGPLRHAGGRKGEIRGKFVNFLLFRLFPLTERGIPCKMEAETTSALWPFSCFRRESKLWRPRKHRPVGIPT